MLMSIGKAPRPSATFTATACSRTEPPTRTTVAAAAGRTVAHRTEAASSERPKRRLMIPPPRRRKHDPCQSDQGAGVYVIFTPRTERLGVFPTRATLAK